MTLIEFLSYGLTHGQKVTLRLRHPYDDKTETLECFFAGFRFEFGKNRTRDERGIIPVFNAVSKNGRMLSAHVGESTWLEFIEDVTPATPSLPPSDAHECASLRKAVRNMERTAKEQAAAILREMDALFPGKKIAIPYDAAAYVRQFDKRGYGASGSLAAAGWKDGHPVYDLRFDFSYQKDQTPQQFDAESWPELLGALIDSISYPDEEAGDNFIDADTDWKAVPAADPVRFPALAACGALDLLRTGLWFDSLDDEEIEAAFSRLRRHSNDNDPEGKTPFADYVRAAWRRMPASRRILFLPKDN